MHITFISLKDEVDGLGESYDLVAAFMASDAFVGGPAISSHLICIHDIRAKRHKPR